MGANVAHLLTKFYLYSYESVFIQQLHDLEQKKQCHSFNLTFRYIDDVLSINHSKLSEYLDVIYPSELQIKDTSDSPHFGALFVYVGE